MTLQSRICPECGAPMFQNETCCYKCGCLFEEPQEEGQTIDAIVELLNTSTSHQWKILATDGVSCYLLTTEKSVFVAVDGFFNGWRSSTVRKELNTTFLASLPTPVSRNLVAIAYEHGETPEHREFGCTTTLLDKVILLDSAEASHISGYRPFGCSLEAWKNKLFEPQEIPCKEGFSFKTQGLSDAAIDSIKEWAKEAMASSSWPDWLLCRDGCLFEYGGTYEELVIPNGVHPVICIDLDLESLIRPDTRSIEISAFIDGEIKPSDSKPNYYGSSSREGWLKSIGALEEDELVVGTEKYRKLLLAYRKLNMPEIEMPDDPFDFKALDAYYSAVRAIEKQDPILGERIPDSRTSSVYDEDIPY